MECELQLAASSAINNITYNGSVPAGKVDLPDWPAKGMCTVEYIPEVKQALRDRCNAASASLSLRRSLFDALSLAGLGQLVEVDEATCRYARPPPPVWPYRAESHTSQSL